MTVIKNTIKGENIYELVYLSCIYGVKMLPPNESEIEKNDIQFL